MPWSSPADSASGPVSTRSMSRCPPSCCALILAGSSGAGALVNTKRDTAFGSAALAVGVDGLLGQGEVARHVHHRDGHGALRQGRCRPGPAGQEHRRRHGAEPAENPPAIHHVPSSSVSSAHPRGGGDPAQHVGRRPSPSPAARHAGPRGVSSAFGRRLAPDRASAGMSGAVQSPVTACRPASPARRPGRGQGRAPRPRRACARPRGARDSRSRCAGPCRGAPESTERRGCRR